ncbi:NADH dehydrogenase (ubiquinone) Fe-S protein 4 [Azospirillaceae bacterium]
MNVAIFQPSKSATQSGQGKTHRWVLEGEARTPRTPDALMGWTGAGDTEGQIRMLFESREQAVAFAQSRGWSYSIAEPRVRKVRPRTAMDNYRTDRIRF